MTTPAVPTTAEKRTSRFQWLALIGIGLSVLVTVIGYWTSPDPEPPPGAQGEGVACLLGCVPPCFNVGEGSGIDLTCALKCTVWCFALAGEVEVEVVVTEGSGETEIVITEGTGEGSGP